LFVCWQLLTVYQSLFVGRCFTSLFLFVFLAVGFTNLCLLADILPVFFVCLLADADGIYQSLFYATF